MGSLPFEFFYLPAVIMFTSLFRVQGIEWSVSSGSNIFGWSKSFPVLNGSQWVQPECNNNTFFKGGPPPCPPPPPSPSPNPPPKPPSPPPPHPPPPPPPPAVGTTCTSQGPANLYTCCKSKRAAN